ncbi:MAG: DUF4397 domain-containing protein [Bacteroidota bacterium]
MKKFLNLSAWFVAGGAFLTLAGCSEDETTTPPAPQTARVMVVHASPDAPPVDLYVDDVKVNQTPLSFPNATAYLTVPAGTRNVKVKVGGDTVTVLNQTLPVAAGSVSTVFAADSVAQLKTLLLADNLAAPAAGKAHVRFVHLSPNADTVDVAVTGGPVLFAGQGFLEYSAFTPVDAGTYDLEVRLAGSATPVLALNGVALAPGKIYTVWARGFVGGVGPQALGAQIIVNN